MTIIDRLTERIPDLAIHPQSLVTLLNVFDDPAVGADALLPIVEQDVGLTAKLLKLCNSPLYNSRREIGSVREAMVRIGNHAFARLAFVLGVEPVLNSGGKPPSDQESLWRHSLSVAWASAALADTLGVTHLRDRVYTAGILHDLGKAAYDGLSEDLGLPEGAGPEEERRVLGVDHAELAAHVVDRWGLPEDVVEMIRSHHEPAGDTEGLAASRAVHLADRLANGAVRGLDDEESDDLVSLMESWNVDAEVADMIRTRLGDLETNVLALALGRERSAEGAR